MAPSFILPPGPYVFRALRLRPPQMEGWDVYALQTALNATGADVSPDGVFGVGTDRAVISLQTERGLEVDGVAGTATQAKLASILCRRANRRLSLPGGIPYGHAEHESSLWLGNHTAPYRNGSRDCGVVQRNTWYHPIDGAFDAPLSIDYLASYIADHHSKYAALGVADRRAWELACGSWNRPAWTDTLASGGTLPQADRTWIESYTDEVTAYVDWSSL